MFPAPPIQLLVILIVAGLLLWVLQQIPMDPAISRIIRVVAIVVVAIWLLYALLGVFGMGSSFPAFRRS